jgi:hypothetical protein
MKSKKAKLWMFYENPYDIETVLDSLTLATRNGKELVYMDRLLSMIRLDPEIDTTELSFAILRDLEIVELKSDTLKGELHHGKR